MEKKKEKIKNEIRKKKQRIIRTWLITLRGECSNRTDASKILVDRHYQLIYKAARRARRYIFWYEFVIQLVVAYN